MHTDHGGTVDTGDGRRDDLFQILITPLQSGRDAWTCGAPTGPSSTVSTYRHCPRGWRVTTRDREAPGPASLTLSLTLTGGGSGARSGSALDHADYAALPPDIRSTQLTHEPAHVALARPIAGSAASRVRLRVRSDERRRDTTHQSESPPPERVGLWPPRAWIGSVLAQP